MAKRSQSDKPKAGSLRQEASQMITTYRQLVHRAAAGEILIGAEIEQAAEALASLALPEMCFARDVRAWRRHSRLCDLAEAGGDAAALRQCARELAVNHPHLLLPVKQAAAMRLQVRKAIDARRAATLATYREIVRCGM